MGSGALARLSGLAVKTRKKSFKINTEIKIHNKKAYRSVEKRRPHIREHSKRPL
jgi:hypothetical protein